MAAAAVVRTEHEKKFDRQIRLWGVHGQSQLENTHIGVLNSNATASETLKNLCLASTSRFQFIVTLSGASFDHVFPDIKAFTLVDDACVTEADLGSNFFCESDWLGKSRAECVRDLLLEMNPDVQGFAQNVNVVQLIRSNIEYFSRYDFRFLST
jgi:amyloid beta precursor protein binding protein 1